MISKKAIQRLIDNTKHKSFIKGAVNIQLNNGRKLECCVEEINDNCLRSGNLLISLHSISTISTKDALKTNSNEMVILE